MAGDQDLHALTLEPNRTLETLTCNEKGISCLNAQFDKNVIK